VLKGFYFHFSAGVGRTGVFIGLVTAVHKMKADQTFHALNIVKEMRDQRGGCVQTTVSKDYIHFARKYRIALHFHEQYFMHLAFVKYCSCADLFTSFYL